MCRTLSTSKTSRRFFSLSGGMSLLTKEMWGFSPEWPIISYLTLLSEPCRPSITIAISSNSRCNLWSNPLNLTSSNNVIIITKRNFTARMLLPYFLYLATTNWAWNVVSCFKKQNVQAYHFSWDWTKRPIIRPFPFSVLFTANKQTPYLYMLPETSTRRVRCLGFVMLSPFSSGWPRLL